jgi:hypothetical protein
VRVGRLRRQRVQGLVGLALIWAGPTILLIGAAARSINITLAAGIVVVLAPLGGRLTEGTRHSRQASVKHRVTRLQANEPRSADFGWMLGAVGCGFGALVGIPWSGIWFWANEAEPLIVSLTGTYRTLAYLGAGLTLLIAGWLSISSSYLLIQGCWRRTCWGYRRRLAAKVESTSITEPAGISTARFAASMATFAALSLLLVGATVVFALRVAG